MDNTERAFALLAELTESPSPMTGETVAAVLAEQRAEGRSPEDARGALVRRGFSTLHEAGWGGVKAQISGIMAYGDIVAHEASAPSAAEPGVVVPAWLQAYVNSKMTQAEAPRGAAPAASAAAPSATTNEGDGSMSGSKVVTSTDREGWAAEWRGSAALQGEFKTEKAYVAFKTAEKQGKARTFGSGAVRTEKAGA